MANQSDDSPDSVFDEGLEQLGMLVIDIFAKHRSLDHETYKNADRRV